MRTLVAFLITRGKCLAAATTKPSVFVTVVMGALTHFTYVALAVILVLSGLGAPIPEDIPLVAAGYMCNPNESPIKDLTYQVDVDHNGVKEDVPRRIPKIEWMICAGMIGVLLGDTVVFRIGKQMSTLAKDELCGTDGSAGRTLGTGSAVAVAEPPRKPAKAGFVVRHLRKVMHSKRREKVERHFAKHGSLTIFVGRFLPGFRSIIFAFAGMSKMSYWQFLLIDGLAALVSVPTFIVLGYAFASNINGLLAGIDHIKHWLIPPIILAIAIAITVYFVRRKKKLALQMAAK
jgi:membrane protein DedA with SNARE-associated domain